MKDFEIKFGKHKGKQVSEIITDEKYFKWLYHKLWDRYNTEEHCFCMEALWKAQGFNVEKLITKKRFIPKKQEIDLSEIEPIRSFHHLGEKGIPGHIPLSEVTQEILDKEDDWIAENYEYIITQK